MDFQTKTDAVFTALRNAIVTGELSQAEHIRASVWAERLQVSQIPVREALRRLEAHGLVEILPHQGARVIPYSRDHLVETYRIRAALESLAARVAMERALEGGCDELVKQMTKLTKKVDRKATSGAWEPAQRDNQELHMTLYRAAGMPRLVALIENLRAAYPLRALNLHPGRRQQAMEQHHRILDAIRSRDPEGVARATEDHLKSALELLLAAPDHDVDLSSDTATTTIGGNRQ